MICRWSVGNQVSFGARHRNHPPPEWPARKGRLAFMLIPERFLHLRPERPKTRGYVRWENGGSPPPPPPWRTQHAPPGPPSCFNLDSHGCSHMVVLTWLFLYSPVQQYSSSESVNGCSTYIYCWWCCCCCFFFLAACINDIYMHILYKKREGGGGVILEEEGCVCVCVCVEHLSVDQETRLISPRRRENRTTGTKQTEGDLTYL